MAPVGSYDSLSAAIAAGTDAVYFGVEGLNMRSRSSANFTLDDLRKIAGICSEAGVRTYLTVNTIIYDADMPVVRSIIDAAAEAGLTAIIASDIAAISYARSRGWKSIYRHSATYPTSRLYVSTQPGPMCLCLPVNSRWSRWRPYTAP